MPTTLRCENSSRHSRRSKAIDRSNRSPSPRASTSTASRACRPTRPSRASADGSTRPTGPPARSPRRRPSRPRAHVLIPTATASLSLYDPPRTPRPAHARLLARAARARAGTRRTSRSGRRGCRSRRRCSSRPRRAAWPWSTRPTRVSCRARSGTASRASASSSSFAFDEPQDTALTKEFSPSFCSKFAYDPSRATAARTAANTPRPASHALARPPTASAPLDRAPHDSFAAPQLYDYEPQYEQHDTLDDRRPQTQQQQGLATDAQLMPPPPPPRRRQHDAQIQYQQPPSQPRDGFMPPTAYSRQQPTPSRQHVGTPRPQFETTHGASSLPLLLPSRGPASAPDAPFHLPLPRAQPH